jgi:hypothetical protein
MWTEHFFGADCNFLRTSKYSDNSATDCIESVEFSPYRHIEFLKVMYCRVLGFRDSK